MKEGGEFMMKKPWLHIFLIGLICVSCWIAMGKTEATGHFRVQAAAAKEALTPDETRADFDLMRKALEEAHTGLYRYSTKPQMDRVFDTQRAKLNRPITKVEFLAVVSETLAQIRCGHTGAMPDA